jgi:hypothetical protein
MVREPSLLSQNPQFLWPPSDVMVDTARFSAHPLIAIAPESLPLIDALPPDFQIPGFRGIRGAVPQALTAIMPMPEAEAMLALAGEIAAPTP